MKHGNALLQVKVQLKVPPQAQVQGQGPVVVEADPMKRGLLTDQRVGSSTRAGMVNDAVVDGTGWMGRSLSYALLLMEPLWVKIFGSATRMYEVVGRGRARSVKTQATE